MNNFILILTRPVIISVCLLLGLSTSHLMAAEFTTSQAVFADNQGSISPQLNFTESSTGDIYLVIRVNGEGGLFFLTKDLQISTDPVPYDTISAYTGTIALPSLNTQIIPSGRYQFYHVLVTTGTSLLDINNWVGGASALKMLNFTVGASAANADADNDGWFDDDLDHDGFHDSDLDKNGFYDDDLDKDGYHDVVDTVTRGKATYEKECSSCHGTDPTRNRDGILRASSASATSSAISRNKGGMAYLTYLTSTDLQDIADYINSL